MAHFFNVELNFSHYTKLKKQMFSKICTSHQKYYLKKIILTFSSILTSPLNTNFAIHYSYETANISENTNWGSARGNKNVVSTEKLPDFSCIVSLLT